jgi:hypothetical protein
MRDSIELVETLSPVALLSEETTDNYNIKCVGQTFQIITFHLDPARASLVGDVLGILLFYYNALLVPHDGLVELADDIFEGRRLDGIDEFEMTRDGFDNPFEHFPPIGKFKFHHVALFSLES